MNEFELLMEHKIVAIFRGLDPDEATAAADRLVEAGIRLMEVTMNTEGAPDIIHSWRRRYGADVSIGAGTVLDREMAELAVAAGARFLISPHLDEELIRFGLERGIEVWPGAMTPTEIVRAWKAGASVIKLFPMKHLGIDYLKEVRAPLDQIPLMATGGVTLDNIGDFIRAGAAAVGLGSHLVDKQLIREARFEELQQKAARFVEAVRQSTS